MVCHTILFYGGVRQTAKSSISAGNNPVAEIYFLKQEVLTMTTYAYVRVSSKDQNEERQLVAVTEYGVERKNIFIDKQSGKDFNRPAYKKLVKKLKPTDVLVIKSIDRLGRNYQEIIEQWRFLTKEKQVTIKVIDMSILNQVNNDLTGTLIADIVLQLLSYVVQTEREFIRQRQAEGIAAAKNRGVKFGRPPLKRSERFYQLKAQWLKGEVSSREAARELKIAHSTFVRWSKEKLS